MTPRRWALPSMPARGRDNRTVVFGVAVLACLIFMESTAAVAGGISIDKPWLRFIIKDRPASGYFTLHNDTDRNIELTGASSTGCRMMMLHQSKETGEVEMMLPVKSVTVPAHGTLNFTPGSYHLMCMNPKSTVMVGRTVPVILRFADGTTMSADFPVKGPDR